MKKNYRPFSFIHFFFSSTLHVETGSTSVADPPHHHRHQSTTALSVSKFSRPFQLATPPISSFTDLTGMRFGTASIRKASATTTTAPATTTTPTTTTTDWSSSVASLAFAEKDDVSASTSTVKDLLDLEHQQTVTSTQLPGRDKIIQLKKLFMKDTILYRGINQKN